MLRALLLAIMFLPTVTHAAPRPGTGLLSKNGPLPATIPLQIRTDAGYDYAITLTAPDTDAPVVSGYLRGGDFFRLLVPPGDHQVTITAGDPDDWQGLAKGFTKAAQVRLRLTFGIRADRREGHQITVRIDDGALQIADQQDQVICQIAERDSMQREYITNTQTPLRYLDQSWSTRSRFCD